RCDRARRGWRRQCPTVAAETASSAATPSSQKVIERAARPGNDVGTAWPATAMMPVPITIPNQFGVMWIKRSGRGTTTRSRSVRRVVIRRDCPLGVLGGTKQFLLGYKPAL